MAGPQDPPTSVEANDRLVELNVVLEVKSHSEYPNRSAAHVVTRITNMLDVGGEKDPAYQTNVVIAFENLLATVAEDSVSEQIAQAAEFEVFAVRVG